MLPEERLPVEGEEEQNHTAEGSASLKAAEEILSEGDPASGGNTADLISTQPLPAVDPPPAVFQQPQRHFQKLTCSRCGLAVPGRSLSPVSQSLKQLQSSKSSLQSSQSSNRSRGDVSGPHRPAATPHDSCFHLLLACLWCRCSVLLLGLLEACSGCLQGLCSSCCCRACARCCSGVQDTPMEELNCHAHCHSVLFESCCEPIECLEFCLDCCEICHRN